MTTGSSAQELHDRLTERRDEIEQAILTRVYGISDPTGAGSATYLNGLRTAVGAAIDYGLEGIRAGARTPPELPPALLIQARIAARNGISLDTVLRRYFAGFALLGDFLIEEAEGMQVGDSLKRLLRVQASIFDCLLEAISEEYSREAEVRVRTVEERRIELVQRLLAGERLDTSELEYNLEASHLGLAAEGPGAGEAIRELATALDRRLLLICPDQTVWAWLGGGRAIDMEKLRRLAPTILPPSVSVALGEPSDGLDGWRLSHRQAVAALPIATRSSEPVTSYADVALLASILQDDLLATSLLQIYLAPLESERDGGTALRETLRAYVGSGRNVSSAAAALGIKRHTVTNRLRTLEERLGRPLGDCAAEMEAALKLRDFVSSRPEGEKGGRRRASRPAALAGRPPRRGGDTRHGP